jgi:hypothetical protein
MNDDLTSASRIIGNHVAKVLPPEAEFILNVIMPDGRCVTISSILSQSHVHEVMRQFAENCSDGRVIPPEEIQEGRDG